MRAPFDYLLTCNYSPWSRYRGGAQKSVHQLASALSRNGKNVCVLYSRVPWEPISIPKTGYSVRWAFFFAIRPGISSPFRFFNGISFFYVASRLCAKSTVILGNGDEASLLGLVRRKRLFLYTSRYPNYDRWLHGARWSLPSTWVEVFLREPRFACMALAMRFAGRVLCTSDSAAGQLRDCFSFVREKCGLLPNGIDPLFLEAPLPLQRRKGIAFFGRVTRAKGVLELVEAYSRLPAEIRGRHPLSILGDGPLLGPCRKLAAEKDLENQLHFHPWAQGMDLITFLSRHRMVVLPSLEESFGNTMLETLACGLPLVSTTAGSIPEVVNDQAVLVPPGDADALARAIGVVLLSVDGKGAQSRRDYVRDRFSWEKTAERLLCHVAELSG